MKAIRRLVLAATFAGLAAPFAQAGVSTEDAAGLCKAEAQARYGSAEQLARVKFKGIYGSAALRKVRLQVLPAEGRSFLAICEVNGQGGLQVTLSPAARGATGAAAAAG